VAQGKLLRRFGCSRLLILLGIYRIHISGAHEDAVMEGHIESSVCVLCVVPGEERNHL
jgi:hypothetical protein